MRSENNIIRNIKQKANSLPSVALGAPLIREISSMLKPDTSGTQI
jgi:hypothetical protein